MANIVAMRYVPAGLAMCLLLSVAGCTSDAPTETGVAQDIASIPPGADALDTSPDTGPVVDPPPPPPPPQCVANDECFTENPCLAALCVEGVCVEEIRDGVCDDGDPCTLDDACQLGECVGQALDCGDGNICTKDVCLGGECKWFPEDSVPCSVTVAVTNPARAATLDGNSQVVLEGVYESPAGVVESLSINGEDVSPWPDGTFQHVFNASVGINIIEVELEDEFGRQARRVQSFAWSPELLPPGDMGLVQPVPGASGVFISPESFDDDDLSDMDDLATVVWLLLDTFDINAAIPHPLTAEIEEPGFLWCSWEVDLDEVTFVTGPVELEPVYSGLKLTLELQDLRSDVSATADAFLCPDAIGEVSADTALVEAMMFVGVTASGSLIVETGEVTVDISGAEVTIEEGAASLFNWLINWFEDDLAWLVAEQMKEWVQADLAPVVNGVLSGVTQYDVVFDVPSPVSGETVPVKLGVAPTDAYFSPEGAEFASDMGLGTDKGTSHPVVGQVLRSGCGTGVTPSLELPHDAPIEAYAHEDLVNQLLFNVWWSGQTKFTLTDEWLGPYLTDYGVDNVVLELDPLLAPVATTCTSHGGPEIQVGDVHVNASFNKDGVPGTLEMFASARARVTFGVEESPDGTSNVALAMQSIEELSMDEVTIGGLDEVNSALIEMLVTEALLDIFVETYMSQVAGSFPVPSVD
ncbi:MAG: hypothetical protein VX938_02170, partial [Myxococcota bacterium]|nr:hypothetical protein [Myxococcota bacterium]